MERPTDLLAAGADSLAQLASEGAERVGALAAPLAHFASDGANRAAALGHVASEKAAKAGALASQLPGEAARQVAPLVRGTAGTGHDLASNGLRSLRRRPGTLLLGLVAAGVLLTLARSAIRRRSRSSYEGDVTQSAEHGDGVTPSGSEPAKTSGAVGH